MIWDTASRLKKYPPRPAQVCSIIGAQGFSEKPTALSPNPKRTRVAKSAALKEIVNPCLGCLKHRAVFYAGQSKLTTNTTLFPKTHCKEAGGKTTGT
jgi:hypothetical protein